jgi:PIN domain nuclease of toxin-antitoxin system
LLDTHALLWIAAGSRRLSDPVRRLVQARPPADFAAAAISLLEIARLAHCGEVDLGPQPAEWLDEMPHRFTVLPLTPGIAWRSVSLDWTHKDPADRLICATTLEHKLTLVTNDKEIIRWGGVPVLW